MNRLRIKKVLFATDFSIYSEKARQFALDLASRFQASVLVLHVIEGLGLDDDEKELRQWMTRLEEKVRHKLELEIDYFRRHKVAAQGELVWGTPWRLINQAADKDADLVVMGSHGLSRDNPQLGTTSHKVALTCGKPLLIVRH